MRIITGSARGTRLETPEGTETRPTAERVKEACITKSALTVVGDFLGNDYDLSKLYDKTFTTEFRKGVTE